MRSPIVTLLGRAFLVVVVLLVGNGCSLFAQLSTTVEYLVQTEPWDPIWIPSVDDDDNETKFAIGQTLRSFSAVRVTNNSNFQIEVKISMTFKDSTGYAFQTKMLNQQVAGNGGTVTWESNAFYIDHVVPQNNTHNFFTAEHKIEAIYGDPSTTVNIGPIQIPHHSYSKVGGGGTSD